MELVDRLLNGDLKAAPRILTLLEKGDPAADDIMQRLTNPPLNPPLPEGEGRGEGEPPSPHSRESRNPSGPPSPHSRESGNPSGLPSPHSRESGNPSGLGISHTIGITGPPGAGKSTLVETLATQLRKQNRTVGLLVVDPSSPFTGGAILGDRVRMRDHFLDPGVFIRSIATRGASGGLAAIVPNAIRVLEAAGLDVIIVETAGVGQTELDVMHTVDTVAVVVVPEAGDAIQTMKAGLLEIADVLVVNKADRPGAKRMANDLQTTVHLGSRDMDWWTIPVLQTEAVRNKGVTDLLDALERHHSALKDAGRLQTRRAAQRRSEFHTALTHRLLDRIAAHINSPHSRESGNPSGLPSSPHSRESGNPSGLPSSPHSGESRNPEPSPHSGESRNPEPSPHSGESRNLSGLSLAEIIRDVETGRTPPATAADHVLKNPHLLA